MLAVAVRHPRLDWEVSAETFDESNQLYREPGVLEEMHDYRNLGGQH